MSFIPRPKLPKGNSFLSEKTGDLELEVDFLQSRLGSIKDLLEKERQLSKPRNWTTKGPIYSHAKQILQSHKIALKSLQRSQSSQSQASFKSNLGRGAGDEFEKPIENEIKSKVKEINSYRPKSTKDMVGTNDEVYDEAESHRSFQEALNNWRESRKGKDVITKKMFHFEGSNETIDSKEIVDESTQTRNLTKERVDEIEKMFSERSTSSLSYLEKIHYLKHN